MENKLLIGITTFRKPNSLQRLLESLFEHGYDKHTIHVADDAQSEDSEFNGVRIGSALEVVNNFKGVRCSYGNARGGISKNKNRNLKFMLDSDYNHVLLLDDDLEFVRPGLYEELLEVCEKNRINHITGQWSSSQPELEQLTGGGWSTTFPVQAMGHNVTWHEGSHGCSGFFTRKCIEEIGYMNVLKEKYGYEHSLYTSRAMLAVDKRTPKWHPQHSRASRFYTGQAAPIPNNYEIENVHANSQEYLELLTKVWEGKGLHIKDPNLTKKETTV